MSDEMKLYDAGLLGGGHLPNADWWQDYLRAEIERANEFCGEQYEHLRADLAARREREQRMREALEWYGEQARLCRIIHKEGDAGRHALNNDGGKRARAALSAMRGEP